MITNFVPGAYITHDQLHIRGGHQTSWLVDGVPVPNTNIASNIGPQFDPKDIDYLEVSRGSYGAELGDRTYGVFNVVPRTGFERNREAELVLSAGNFYQTNDQFSFGSHTERFAYYASVNGNRSNLGIANAGPASRSRRRQRLRRLRFAHLQRRSFKPASPGVLRCARTSIRFPTIPSQRPGERIDSGNDFTPQYPSLDLRDSDHESDAIVNFSWVHTFNSKLLLTVSPFYHYNAANYDSSPATITPRRPPTNIRRPMPEDRSASARIFAKNNFQVGFYGFHQRDQESFSVLFNCPNNGDPNFPQCGGSPFTGSELLSGGLSALFIDDKFKPFPWLTLSAGMRPTHFSGGVSETAISPRFGIALTVPRFELDFPRLLRPLLPGAAAGHRVGSTTAVCATRVIVKFAPLNGERDEEAQFGVTIPWRGWILDADTFRTNAHQLLRSQRHRRIEFLFPAHHRERAHPWLGTHTAFSAHRAPRADSPRLFESDR